MYERFDASHGVSNIKLDNYRALGQIKEKTKLYLDEQETIDLLEQWGSAIATDYINANPTMGYNAQTNNAGIDESRDQTHASDAVLASSTLSADSASHISTSTGMPHLLSPPSDEIHTIGLLPVTELQEGTLPHENGKEHAIQYANKNSGLGTIEPDVSIAIVAG